MSCVNGFSEESSMDDRMGYCRSLQVSPHKIFKCTKILTLRWNNLMNTTLIKRSNLVSPMME